MANVPELLLDTLSFRGRDPYFNPMRVYARKVWEETQGGAEGLKVAREFLAEKLTEEAKFNCVAAEVPASAVTRALSIFDGTINTCRYNVKRAAEDAAYERKLQQREQRKAQERGVRLEFESRLEDL